MSLNRLLTATALVDPGTADKLCSVFNKAVAAAGDITAEVGVVLSLIDRELQHAVLDVVAAQPPGCQLDWSGESQALQCGLLTSLDGLLWLTVAFQTVHKQGWLLG
jgi:hypothetical protein